METSMKEIWVGIQSDTQEVHLLVQLSRAAVPNTAVAECITEMFDSNGSIIDHETFKMLHTKYQNPFLVEKLLEQANKYLDLAKESVIVGPDGLLLIDEELYEDHNRASRKISVL